MQPSTSPHCLRPYRYYLVFILIACCGACLWQLFLPQIGSSFSVWGSAPGWQREIALWNAALISAILAALRKKCLSAMRLLVLQSAILCWALGANHLFALYSHRTMLSLHFLGVLEVMLLGGVWGALLLVKYRPKKHGRMP